MQEETIVENEDAAQKEEVIYENVTIRKSSVVPQTFEIYEEMTLTASPRGAVEDVAKTPSDLNGYGDSPAGTNVDPKHRGQNFSHVQTTDLDLSAPDDKTDFADERAYEIMVRGEAVYENVVRQQHQNRPVFDLSVTYHPEELEPLEIKSVKDRMFLSTDDASCLLFTQTVTSPMLTPSEENIDFLKGFRRTSDGDTPSSSDATNSGGRCDETDQQVDDITDNDVSERADPGEPLVPDHRRNEAPDDETHETDLLEGYVQPVDDVDDDRDEEVGEMVPVLETLNCYLDGYLDVKEGSKKFLENEIENGTWRADSETGFERGPKNGERSSQEEARQARQSPCFIEESLAIKKVPEGHDKSTERDDQHEQDTSPSDVQQTTVAEVTQLTPAESILQTANFIVSEKMFAATEDVTTGNDTSDVATAEDVATCEDNAIDDVAKTEDAAAPKATALVVEEREENATPREDVDHHHRQLPPARRSTGDAFEVQPPRHDDEVYQNGKVTDLDEPNESDDEVKLIENPSRMVDALKTKFLTNASAGMVKTPSIEKLEISQLKTLDIMKQINKFEGKTPEGDEDDSDGSATDVSALFY